MTHQDRPRRVLRKRVGFGRCQVRQLQSVPARKLRGDLGPGLKCGGGRLAEGAVCVYFWEPSIYRAAGKSELGSL